MANRWRKSGNSDRFYFGWAPKSLRMVTALMKLKEACSLEEKPIWPSSVWGTVSGTGGIQKSHNPGVLTLGLSAAGELQEPWSCVVWVERPWFWRSTAWPHLPAHRHPQSTINNWRATKSWDECLGRGIGTDVDCSVWPVGPGLWGTVSPRSGTPGNSGSWEDGAQVHLSVSLPGWL